MNLSKNDDELLKRIRFESKYIKKFTKKKKYYVVLKVPRMIRGFKPIFEDYKTKKVWGSNFKRRAVKKAKWYHENIKGHYFSMLHNCYDLVYKGKVIMKFGYNEEGVSI